MYLFCELILPNIFKMPGIETYSYEKPAFPGHYFYLFTNRFGDKYEVTIGRKAHDYFHISISFGVINEEYQDEEYTLTNKGDIFRVLHTVCKILCDYLEEHPNVHTIEYSGEAKKGEKILPSKATSRTLVFTRFAKQYFKPPKWQLKFKDNHVFIVRDK